MADVQANSSHCSNVASMLGHRLRHRPNNKTTLVQRVVLSVIRCACCTLSVLGWTLDVRICRRQVPTSNVDPRTERVD